MEDEEMTVACEHEMESINQPYGEDLETIERSISAIIRRYWIDEDGFVYGGISGVTNKPYTDDDPDLDFPLEKLWSYNGSFPNGLKRTFINYEDADMTAGELLLAYVARARVEPSDENLTAMDSLAELMTEVPERVGRENPYGFGFLPKLHGGLRYLDDCFEFSADQLLKWMNALDAYREFTTDADRQRRIDAILLAVARWLDAHDFVTPYMGNPNYARLNHYRHYHTCSAYICARGYQLSGDTHLLAEARFFRDHILKASVDSTAANSLNLVLEALARLIGLMPEDTEVWLDLMRRDWKARVNYYHPVGTETHSGYVWNVGVRMATNYLVALPFLPEVAGDFDVPTMLLRHNHKDAFYHLTRPQEIGGSVEDGGIMTYRNLLLGLAYMSWLRAYWMSREMSPQHALHPRFKTAAAYPTTLE